MSTPPRSVPATHAPDARSARERREAISTRGAEPRDESAVIEALAQSWSAQIGAVAARFGLEVTDRDELTQRVRVRIWQARTRDRDVELSPSYGYRAAMSAAIDMLRERRATRASHTVSVDLLAHALPAPAPADEASQLERLAQALGALDEPRRIAARMHLSGYHLRDIVTMTGWSEARARNLLYRALDDLRQLLDEDGTP